MRDSVSSEIWKVVVACTKNRNSISGNGVVWRFLARGELDFNSNSIPLSFGSTTPTSRGPECKEISLQHAPDHGGIPLTRVR